MSLYDDDPEAYLDAVPPSAGATVEQHCDPRVLPTQVLGILATALRETALDLGTVTIARTRTPGGATLSAWPSECQCWATLTGDDEECPACGRPVPTFDLRVEWSPAHVPAPLWPPPTWADAPDPAA